MINDIICIGRTPLPGQAITAVLYACGRYSNCPIHLNPCSMPYGVNPQAWTGMLHRCLTNAYSLGMRQADLLQCALYDLYEEAGVFEPRMGLPDWAEEVSARSAKVTFRNVYRHMEKIKISLEDPSGLKGKAGNGTRDAYARLLGRLQAFSRDFSIEYQLFGSEDGVCIGEIFGRGKLALVDLAGLGESPFRKFLTDFAGEAQQILADNGIGE